MEIKNWKQYEEAVKTEEAIQELLDAYDPNPTNRDELNEIAELKKEMDKLSEALQIWWIDHEHEEGDAPVF